MGAWGYTYKSNDDYYNEMSSYIKPLILSLKKGLVQAKTGNFSDSSGSGGYELHISTLAFRGQLMWTFKMIQSNSDNTLSDEAMKVFTESIKQVREQSEVSAPDWSEPEEFLRTVEAEMKEIEDWLAEFSPSGFLTDRIGAITDAIAGDQK